MSEMSEMTDYDSERANADVAKPDHSVEVEKSEDESEKKQE